MRHGMKYAVAGALAVIVLAAIGYIAYTRFGIGMSSEQRARFTYAKSEMQRIAATMKDPDSIKFSNTFVVKHVDGNYVLCGSYNAKNSYGAYVGYQIFYAAGSLFAKQDDSGFMDDFKTYCSEGGPAIYAGFYRMN